MYKILKTEGRAKRAEFTTVHGTVQTPVFMNVGTVAAIKGAVSTEDLEGIGTQIELSNTYHLHVRPGDDRRRNAYPPGQRGERLRRLFGLSPRLPQAVRRRAESGKAREYAAKMEKSHLTAPAQYGIIFKLIISVRLRV